MVAGLLALLLPTAAVAQHQDRNWYLAAIYVGELSSKAYGVTLNTAPMLEIQRADALGGSGAITVRSPVRGVLFRQRFDWRFPGSARTLSASRALDIQYALTGERPTTNSNGAALNGSGSSSPLGSFYASANVMRNFARAGTFDISSSAPNNRIDLYGGSYPASAVAQARADLINVNQPQPEIRSFWFNIELSNNEGANGTQIWQIHYVYVSDPAAAHQLPGRGDVPGLTFIAPYPDCPLLAGMQKPCVKPDPGSGNWDNVAGVRRPPPDLNPPVSPVPPVVVPPAPPIRPVVPTPVQCPPASALIPLQLWWNPERGDNMTTASSMGVGAASANGYRYVRNEGFIYNQQFPGTVPLRQYWNAARGDNFAAASAQGQQAATVNGYVFAWIEGYVFADGRCGSVPLSNWWHAGREDNFQTATDIGAASARSVGYGFAWVEGYVIPAR